MQMTQEAPERSEDRPHRLGVVRRLREDVVVRRALGNARGVGPAVACQKDQEVLDAAVARVDGRLGVPSPPAGIVGRARQRLQFLRQLGSDEIAGHALADAAAFSHLEQNAHRPKPGLEVAPAGVCLVELGEFDAELRIEEPNRELFAELFASLRDGVPRERREHPPEPGYGVLGIAEPPHLDQGIGDQGLQVGVICHKSSYHCRRGR